MRDFGEALGKRGWGGVGQAQGSPLFLDCSPAAGVPCFCCPGGQGCRKMFCCHLVGKRNLGDVRAHVAQGPSQLQGEVKPFPEL